MSQVTKPALTLVTLGWKAAAGRPGPAACGAAACWPDAAACWPDAAASPAPDADTPAQIGPAGAGIFRSDQITPAFTGVRGWAKSSPGPVSGLTRRSLSD